MKSHHNFYAVVKGRNPGIYSSWTECQQQVDGLKHNSFKGFNSLREATDFMLWGGMSLNEIDLVDGEVLLRKSLIEVKPDIMEEITSSVDQEEGQGQVTHSAENKEDDEEVPCISIDGSCRKKMVQNRR